jgi:hypothetical protein
MLFYFLIQREREREREMYQFTSCDYNRGQALHFYVEQSEIQATRNGFYQYIYMGKIHLAHLNWHPFCEDMHPNLSFLTFDFLKHPFQYDYSSVRCFALKWAKIAHTNMPVQYFAVYFFILLCFFSHMNGCQLCQSNSQNRHSLGILSRKYARLSHICHFLLSILRLINN